MLEAAALMAAALMAVALMAVALMAAALMAAALIRAASLLEEAQTAAGAFGVLSGKAGARAQVPVLRTVPVS